MSEQVIDERVVSMKFDNEEFEKKSAQSLSTIQKLKQALDFKNTVKSLDSVEKASKSLDLSHISNSVDAIKEKFSGWEVAARAAITNVTNSAVNAAKRMVESVTIDPVRTGLGVYEQKMNSVQTMLNNSGESLGKVTKILDELNEYSDKTIFSLNDMTTALGKFTAQGVSLEKATTIIKGAANEAASMGAGSAEFSRFIYNLTQAYGMGKMTTIDWKSLENAGVAGKKFKEQLIESYEAMAKLGKVTDKYVGKVNASNLREFLQYGIITADVMTDTFEKYADTTTELGKNAQDAAQQIKTFHQLLDVLAESVASTWSQSFGYIIGDFYEARRLWTNVSNIFEQTVGKMNENRNKLLKAWHDGFIDPAETSLERIKELEQAQRSGAYVGTKDLDAKISGRTLLFDGLANVLNAVLRAITPVKEAFREVFPATTAKGLWEATKNFRDFTAHLKLSDGALKEIKDAAKGFFEILKFGRTLIKDVLGALIPATKEVDSLAVIILKLAGFLGRSVSKVIEAIRSSEGYRNALDGITYAAGLAIKIVGFLITSLFKVGKAAKETGVLQKVFGFLGSSLEVVVNLLARIAPAAVTVFRVVGVAVAGVLTLIGKGLELVEGFFGNLFGKKSEGSESGANIVAGITKGVENNVGEADKAMKNLADGMINSFKKETDEHSPSKVFMALGAFLVAGLVLGILASNGMLSKASDSILGFISTIAEGVGSGAKKIKEFLFGTETEASALVAFFQNASAKIGEASSGLINKIASGISTISTFLSGFNWAAAVTISIIAVLLGGVIKIIATLYKLGDAVNLGFKAANNITKGFNNFAKAFKRMHNPLTETLKGIAVCLLAITASLWLLATLEDTGKLWTSVGALLVSLTAVLIIAEGAAAISHKKDLSEDIKNLALMVLSISGSFVLMGMAFTLIIETLKSTENSWGLIRQAMVVLGGMAVIMMATAAVINRFSKEGSTKAILSMLVWTFSLTKVINAIKELMTLGKDLSSEDIKGLWLGGLLPMFTMMVGLAVVGAGFKNVGVGSALFMLVMISACKQIFESIKDLKISVDPQIIDWLNKETVSLKDLLIMMAVGLGAAAVIMAAVLGPRIESLSKGLLRITIVIAGLMLIAKLAQKLEIKNEDMQKVIGCAIMAGLLCLALAVLALASKDSELRSITGIVFGIAAICLSMAVLANAVRGIDDNGLAAMIATLGIIVIGLATITVAMSMIKDVKSGPLLGVMGTMLVLIGGIALLSTIPDMDKLWTATTSVALIMAALAAVVLAMSRIKDVKKGPILSIAGTLLILIGGLVVIEEVCDSEKLLAATLALAGVMAAFALVALAVSKIKAVSAGPIVAMSLAVAVIAGSLWLLSDYSWDQLSGQMVSMIGVMLSFYMIIKASEKVNPKALGPMIVAVVGVVAVAASLGVLAYFDWDGIYEAAISLSGTLLAVAAAMRIISGGTGGAVNILASAAAIFIVAGSLIVIAHAMNVLKEVPFDYVFMAGIALATIAVSLRILADNAVGAAIASVAIIAVAAALVLIGAALNVFTLVASGDVWSAIGMIAIITVALYALSAVAPMAVVAAAALLITSAALVVLGSALTIIGQAEAGAGTLALIALALIPMALAGMALSLGAAGLIAGGIGLRILAPALVTMGKAYKDLTGTQLAGIAGGLMMMGLAGVVLTAGAAGLIAGGIGVAIMAVALLAMSQVSIRGKTIKALGEGLIPFAIAGVVGTIAGPGLIALSIGLMAVTAAIAAMVKIVAAILDIDLVKMGESAETAGEMVVEGANQGILGGLATLGKTVLGMAKGIINTFATALGIHSPSEVFKWLGQKILQGLGLGVADETLNSGLGDTMKAVADNLLGNFTGELGEGFGKISDMIKDFGKKEKKLVVDEWGYDERGFKSAVKWHYEEDNPLADMFESLGLSDISEQFSSLFSEDTFGGVSDIASLFDDWDFSIDDVTNSMGKLDLSIDGVDASNTEMTKNLSNSIDVFSAYDRSLTVTTADIKKNLLENMIGEEEWRDRLNNMIAVGFDPKVVQEVMNKGKDQGSKIAAALLAEAIPNPDFVKKYNEDFLKTQAIATSTTEVFGKVLDEMIKTGKTAEDYGITFKKTVETINGTYAAANPAYSAANIADEMEDANNEAQRALYSQIQLYENADELRKTQEERIKKATQDNDESIVDSMMSDMSESIKNSINRYMPSTTFVQLGKNICLGLASGIFNYMALTTDAVKMSAEQMITTFKQAMDSHSPSRVFFRLGEFIQEGLARGISSDDAAVMSTKEMGEGLLSEFKAVLNQIMAIMETDETWQPTIRPVVDFTNIQAGAWDAQNMFNGVKIGAQVTAAANDIQAAKNQTYGTPTVAGMSREEFRDFLTGFAETIVEGITSNDGKPVEVNVNLEGDAAGVFKLVRDQNTEYKKTSGGRSALA